MIETMRPLPIERVPGVPPYIAGVSLIRGVAVPVVEVATLLGDTCDGATRFVTIRRERRTIALAVDEVKEVRAVAADDMAALPSLLGDVDAGIVSALTHLDDRLLFVLGHARLIPPDAWATLTLHQNAAGKQVTPS